MYTKNAANLNHPSILSWKTNILVSETWFFHLLLGKFIDFWSLEQLKIVFLYNDLLKNSNTVWYFSNLSLIKANIG